LQIPYFLGIPLGGYLHRHSFPVQAPHTRVPVPPQTPHLLLASQQAVDALGRDLPQLFGHLVAATQLPELAQPFHLLL
jgi:hypothetical protein